MFLEIVSAVVVSKLICDYIEKKEVSKKIEDSVKNYFSMKDKKSTKKTSKKTSKKKDQSNGEVSSNQN